MHCSPKTLETAGAIYNAHVVWFPMNSGEGYQIGMPQTPDPSDHIIDGVTCQTTPTICGLFGS